MGLRFERGLEENARGNGAASAVAGEDGYILLAVLFMVVMVLITLSIAAPKVAADIQRDREIELQHRGMQYRRAIQLYYRKFQAYPPSMDALVKTSEIRFLRRRYVDPATGKDEWHLIHFGENKTPTAIGFFGQAIGGSTLAGVGPGGFGKGVGTSAIGSTTFNTNSVGNGPSGGSPADAQVGGTPPAAVSDPNAGTVDGAGANPAAGVNGAAGTDASGTAKSATGGVGGNGPLSNGQTFGGGGIIGVESTSPKATILEYKKKKHFNEWEFVYDPASERQTVSSSLGTVGQPAGPGNSNSPVTNSPGISNQPPPGQIPPPGGGTPNNPGNNPPPGQNPNQQQ